FGELERRGVGADREQAVARLDAVAYLDEAVLDDAGDLRLHLNFLLGNDLAHGERLVDDGAALDGDLLGRVLRVVAVLGGVEKPGADGGEQHQAEADLRGPAHAHVPPSLGLYGHRPAKVPPSGEGSEGFDVRVDSSVGPR